MPTHYEVRDFPDDPPFIFTTLSAAERFARKRSDRIGDEVLIYEVTDHGETYLGTA